MAAPRPSVKLLSEKRDLWVGVYWNVFWSGLWYQKWLEVYICVLPCCVIKITRALKPEPEGERRRSTYL